MSGGGVPPITDPHNVREMLVSAIAGIEEAHGIVTVTFVTNRVVPDGFGDSGIERAISARLIMSRNSMEQISKGLLEYLSER